MPFIEAFRQFQFRVKRENFANVHVSLIPEQHGEHKTKPTQNSVKELRGLGISPDIVILISNYRLLFNLTNIIKLICRSMTPMPDSAREKISMFCHVDKDQVVSMPDVNNIFKVPLILYEHKLAEWLADRLSLTSVKEKLADLNSRKADMSDGDLMPCIMQSWIELSERYFKILNDTSSFYNRFEFNRADSLTKEVVIALVGKYTTQSDTYTSIIKSLEHAGLESNRKVVIKVLIILI